MNKRKMQYIYEVIFGSAAMLLSIIFSNFIGNITLAAFIITIIITGIASVIKITLIDDSITEIKTIFNGIGIYYYHLSISYFFIISMEILSNDINYNSISMYGNILNCFVPIILIWAVKKGKSNDKLINIISIVSLGIIFFTTKVMNKDITTQDARVVSYILVGISNILYVVIAKTVIYKSEYKGKQYFNIFLLCRLIEYICIFAIDQNDKRIIMCLSIEMAQIYFILKSALISCIEGPRKMTFTALEEAESKIDSHKSANKIIVNLSHELKTPINIIRSAVDLLLLDCNEEELKEKITEIKVGCTEIMNVIQLMIDIQKLKTGTCIIRNKVYNIVNVVENSIEAISHEYSRSNILFNPAEEEIFVNVDMELFQQGLIGLFTALVQNQNNIAIYIEMNKLENDKVQMLVFSEQSSKIGEIIDEIKDFKYQENMVELLQIQYLQEILHMHKGGIEYIEDGKKSSIEIQFPCSQNPAIIEIQIDDNNVNELREKIKYSYPVA